MGEALSVLDQAERAARLAGAEREDVKSVLAAIEFQRGLFHAAGARMLARFASDAKYGQKAKWHLEAAKAAYGRCVELEPNEPAAWFNLGLGQLQTDEEKAAEAFRRAP